MRRALSLTQRLNLLVLAALAPALLLLIYTQVTQRASRMEEARQSAYRAGEQASLEMQRIMSGAQLLLEAIGNAPAVKTFDQALCAPFLAGVLARAPQFSAMGVYDANGQLRCRNIMATTAASARDLPSFQEAMASGRFTIGRYMKGETANEAFLPLAAPILDVDDKPTGAVIASLDLAWLNHIVKDRQFDESAALTVADRDGTIIARHPYPERFVGTRIPETFLPLVTAERPGAMEVLSQDGTRRIIGYFPASVTPQSLYVSAGVGYDKAMEPVREATYQGGLIVLLGAISALILATASGRMLLTRPMEQITGTIEAWRKGDAQARTGMVASRSEIGQVGAAIDQFLDDLQAGKTQRAILEEQQALLNNELQHRVKNALATVSAVAGQTFKGPAQRADLVKYLARVRAIADAFDMLRRSEWQGGTLHEVVEKTLVMYPPERRHVEGPELSVGPKATLALSLALHELATNSAKYGAFSVPSGVLRVTWSTDGSTLVLIWKEQDGPAVHSPEKAGFGTRMITTALAADLGASVELDYAEDGLECRISASMERLSI